MAYLLKDSAGNVQVSGSTSGIPAAEIPSESSYAEDLSASAEPEIPDVSSLFKNCSLGLPLDFVTQGKFSSIDEAELVFAKTLAKSVWKIILDASDLCDCFSESYTGGESAAFSKDHILDMADYQVINAYHGDPLWDADCVLADEGSADDIFNSYYCRTSGGKVFILDLSFDGDLGDIMILNPDNQFVYGVMIAAGDSSNEKYEKLFKEYYEYCQNYSPDTTDIPENGDLTAPSDPTGDSSGVSDEDLLNNAYQAIIDYCANYEGSLNPDCYPKNGKVNRTGSVAYVTVDQWDMQIWWQYYIPKNATVLLDEETGTVIQCTVNY